MKREELKPIVIACIAHTSTCSKPVEEIEEEDRLQDDLGMDSLDFVELIMALERKLDIGVPDEEIENRVNDTVGEMIDFIQSKTN